MKYFCCVIAKTTKQDKSGQIREKLCTEMMKRSEILLPHIFPSLTSKQTRLWSLFPGQNLNILP